MRLRTKGIVENVKIGKVYGTNWEKVSNEEYIIRGRQIISGMSKDYVFEVVIPAINQ